MNKTMEQMQAAPPPLEAGAVYPDGTQIQGLERAYHVCSA